MTQNKIIVVLFIVQLPLIILMLFNSDSSVIPVYATASMIMVEILKPKQEKVKFFEVSEGADEENQRSLEEEQKWLPVLIPIISAMIVTMKNLLNNVYSGAAYVAAIIFVSTVCLYCFVEVFRRYKF